MNYYERKIKAGQVIKEIVNIRGEIPFMELKSLITIRTGLGEKVTKELLRDYEILGFLENVNGIIKNIEVGNNGINNNK